MAKISVPIAFVGVILIWSTTPLAIQWSSAEWGFLFAVTARMVIGAQLCFLLLKILKQELPWHTQALRTYAAAGLGVYGAMLSVYWAAQFIPSGLVAVLFGLSPILTGILASIWLSEASLTRYKLMGMVLGFFGVAIIFKSNITLESLAWQGICGVLFAVFLHCISAVWVKRVSENLGGLQVTTGALILVTPLYVFTWLLFDGEFPTSVTMKPFMSLMYLSVFGSVIGFVFYFFILQKMEASKVALLTLVTPVLALIIGQLLNGERPDEEVWMGTLCIISALSIYLWGGKLTRIAAVNKPMVP